MRSSGKPKAQAADHANPELQQAPEWLTQPGSTHEAVAEYFGSSVDIRRSKRRKKTISGRMNGEQMVVMIPHRLNPTDMFLAVHNMVERLSRKTQVTVETNDELLIRAQRLNQRHLENRATVAEIKWVTNMDRQWGSCSPKSNRIRISHRLQVVPDYVLDTVIIHELVHTFVPNHSKEFYRWAERAPHYERARGYLEAFQRWKHD